MKLVAIGGSPRKNGNSMSLMRRAVDAAVGRGASAQTFFPRQMDIHGCHGCESCQRAPDSVCVQKDDMHQIYAAIRECDVLLLSSPVYFYGVSSWLKEVIDRCYALITPKFPDLEVQPPRVAPGKALYVITAQEEAASFYGYQILSTVVHSFSWLDMDHRGQLIATGLSGPHDWKARPDLIAAAEALITA